jgi:hypothetical protein
MRRVGKGLLRWGLIAACAALVLPGVCAARAEPVRVTVAPTPITRPIAPGFLGLAFEYSSIPGWVGSDLARPNPVLVQLIRNLNPRGRPVIRIGGLSTDHSWWPVPGMAEPKGITYALGPRWAASMAALARALDAQLVLGVNLEADSARLARTEADEFLTTIGRRYVSALDLGNEPPLYRSIPWYRVRDGQLIPWYLDEGTEVFGRSLSWGAPTYVTDYARILAGLPRVPILGPDTQQAAWFAAYQRFVSPKSRVRTLASHGYGLNNCVTRPQSAAYPSVAHLLSSYALHDLLVDLTPYIGVAHANGAQFRIDEMGSVTCNGRPGVSNTMAAALWAAGALFSVAQDGVDGVNLHSYNNLPNALFDFTDTAQGWTGAVHPLYYGALLFAHAAPAGSRLLRVSLHGPPTVHAWATSGPGATHRVVLINDSLTASARVTLGALHGVLGTGLAQLERLTAPSPSATSGVSLGGRSFGTVTTTATLRPAVRDTLSGHAGHYLINVPAASAVTLTFAPRSRR